MNRPTYVIEREMLDALRVIRSHWALMRLGSTSGSLVGSPSSDVVTGLDRRVSLALEVTQALNGWARIVVEDRGTQHGIPLGTDTLGLVEFLERHAQWMSGHEAGPDCADELTACAQKVKLAALGPSQRRFVVGGCIEVGYADLGYPEHLDYNRRACDGELLAVLRMGDALLPASIQCSSDTEHRWEPRQWLLLGRRVLSVLEDKIGA